MDLFIELLGNLILTFFTFTVTIISAMFSIYQDGIPILKQRFENEEKSTQENIKKQLSKNTKKFKRNEIIKNLNQLRKIEKEARKKISLLNLKFQIVKLFICFILSFIFIELSTIIKGNFFCFIKKEHIFIVISLIIFYYGIYISWNLLNIFIDIKNAIDINKKTTEFDEKQKLTSALEKLANIGPTYLKNLYLEVNSNPIKENNINISAKSQQEFKLSTYITNNEERMAKNIEVGIIVPLDFLITKKSSYSITNDGNRQIVRFNREFIHRKTSDNLGSLFLTPLSTGRYEIKTFIKGENVENLDKKSFFIDAN